MDPSASASSSPRLPKLLTGLVVGLLAWVLYYATSAPGVWWGDGPELTTAAYILGIPHTTGYPFYLLTGHLFIKLFSGVDPIRVMTLYNVFAQAAAWGLLASLLIDIVGDAFDRPPTALSAIATAGMALIAAVAPSAWERGTYAEVYPLTWLLISLILIAAWLPRNAAPNRARILTLAALLGLASVNHYSIVAYYPLVGLMLIGWIRRTARPWLTAAWTLAAYLAPLAFNLYLPIRAHAHPALNWDNPSTLPRLLFYLSAKRYASYTGIDLANAPSWIRWWGAQWVNAPPALTMALGLLLIAAATAGLIRLTKRRPAWGIGLIVALWCSLWFVLGYRSQDLDAYYIVSLPPAIVGWIECAALAPRSKKLRTAALVPGALAILSASFMYPHLDLSRERAAGQFAVRLLKPLPRGAVVLAVCDFDLYPVIYEQMVHRSRPDVAVISLPWFYQDWYSPYLPDANVERVPFRMGRSEPADKAGFDADLINGVILPAFGHGRRVFTSGNNALMADLFPFKSAARLLPEDYRPADRYRALIPNPILYELTPNPALASMSEQKIKAVIARYYAN